MTSEQVTELPSDGSSSKPTKGNRRKKWEIERDRIREALRFEDVFRHFCYSISACSIQPLKENDEGVKQGFTHVCFSPLEVYESHRNEACFLFSEEEGKKWACNYAKAQWQQGGDIFTLIAIFQGLDTKRDFSQILAIGRGIVGIEPETTRQVRQRIQKEKGKEELTELGNVRRFTRLCGDVVRYVEAWNSFMCYDGKRWRKSNIIVQSFAKQVVDSILDEAKKAQDPYRDDLLKHWEMSQRISSIRSMIQFSRDGLLSDVEEFDHEDKAYFFNVENGTIDLRTGELTPHDPKHYITKIAHVAYDGEAQCPKFLEFLSQLFPKEDDPKGEIAPFLQELFGAWLTGLQNTESSPFLIATGKGANGKSVLFDLLRYIMGSYSTTLDAKELTYHQSGMGNDRHPTAIAALAGARFVWASEDEQDRRLRAAQIKKMAGGEVIKARFMRADEFEFKPQFKLALTTNYEPEIDGLDGAIWRRLTVLPFRQCFQGQRARPRHELMGELVAEAPGILRWMVEGAKRFCKQGKLRPAPEVCESEKKEYRMRNNPIGRFAEARLQLGGRSDFEFSSEIKNAYEQWCQLEDEEEISQKRLTQSLERLDPAVKPVKKYNKRGLLGVRLLSDNERRIDGEGEVDNDYSDRSLSEAEQELPFVI